MKKSLSYTLYMSKKEGEQSVTSLKTGSTLQYINKSNTSMKVKVPLTFNVGLGRYP